MSRERHICDEKRTVRVSQREICPMVGANQALNECMSRATENKKGGAKERARDRARKAKIKMVAGKSKRDVRRAYLRYITRGVPRRPCLHPRTSKAGATIRAAVG